MQSFLPDEHPEKASRAASVPQCQQESDGRALQSVGLHRVVGLTVRTNFQVSLQYQNNAALLVRSYCPLLLAMGERFKSFCVYKF